MSKTIVLKSNDDQTFEVDASVISLSLTIKNMIDDDCADQTIPLLEVTGDVFAMVLEYCKKHTERSDSDAKKEDIVADESNKDLIAALGDPTDAELTAWDAEFVANRKMPVLFKLIKAANFLNIKGLLDLLAQTIADAIKDMMPEEVRKIFNIKNDFTKEEEEALQKENAWAFDCGSA